MTLGLLFILLFIYFNLSTSRSSMACG